MLSCLVSCGIRGLLFSPVRTSSVLSLNWQVNFNRLYNLCTLCYHDALFVMFLYTCGFLCCLPLDADRGIDGPGNIDHNTSPSVTVRQRHNHK